MNKIDIPVNQKLCLSIEEAAQYSMLGENRIRKLIEEDKTLDWVLHVGSWVRVKRPQFEAWVLRQSNL